MEQQDGRVVPLLLHPATFIGASILLGELFALQEWVDTHRITRPLSIAEVRPKQVRVSIRLPLQLSANEKSNETVVLVPGCVL